MPALQQIATAQAAWARMQWEKPSKDHHQPASGTTVSVTPTTPRAVLFNTAKGVAYQVLASSATSEAVEQQQNVSFFTVRRIPLADEHALSLHIEAASFCQLPFCIVEGGVTWSSVVSTVVYPSTQACQLTAPWNVQVLGQDAKTGAWRPITPLLSSRIETQFFLCTDVEVLFSHYQTNALYMCATLLTPEMLGHPESRTPPDRSTAFQVVTPPPAPTKAPRPPQSMPNFAFLSLPSPVAAAIRGGAPLPRNLARDFDVAVAAPPVKPSEAPYMWSREALVRQQIRWGIRRDELLKRASALTLRERLRLVRAELRMCDQASHDDGALSVDAAGNGVATWTLSLFEYHCTLLVEEVHRALTESTDELCSSSVGRCARYLQRAHRQAGKVINVVDAVLRTAGTAESSGLVPPDFPRDWLVLLLSSLRLRCLRHVALAQSAGALEVASTNHGAQHPHRSAERSPLSVSWAADLLLDEALQTAEWAVEALRSIGERGVIVGLSPSSLAGTLLMCVLSLVELAAYLPMNTHHRCQLLMAMVQVCRVRLHLTQLHDGEGWLPQCVHDVVARMKTKLVDFPLTSPAFSAYADLIALMRDAFENAKQHNSTTRGDSRPAERDGGDAALPCNFRLGYTVQYLDSGAEVDAAFVQGNTVVRELRRLAAPAPERQDAESPPC